MSDRNEHYVAYEHYSGVLRTWLVAYGIGAPVLILTNDPIWQKLHVSGDSRTIALLFLFGVAFQIFLATLNKTIMWISYYADGHPEFENKVWFKIAKFLRRQFWIDFVVDIGAMVLFTVATYYVFQAITN